MFSKIKSLLSRSTPDDPFSEFHTSHFSEIEFNDLSNELIQSIYSKKPFSSYDQNQKDESLKEAKVFSYSENQIIFASGENSEFVPYLLSGSMAMQTDDGKAILHNDADQSANFAVAYMNPMRFTAKAASQRTLILWVKRENIEDYIEENTYSVEVDQADEGDWEDAIAQSEMEEVVEHFITDDHREKLPPVPVDLSHYVSELQMASIKKLENFGWEIFFIRRSDMDNIQTVMHDPKTNKTLSVDKDGLIHETEDMNIRPESE